ncbi:hypothetical protein NIES4101_54080 [Calothrix sp. NIES-4101]|nr:hypothetical protein NIES4101_54080 [Calothrix sp. NIES-4101]
MQGCEDRSNTVQLRTKINQVVVQKYLYIPNISNPGHYNVGNISFFVAPCASQRVEGSVGVAALKGLGRVACKQNRSTFLEGAWGTQPSPNRGFGGESPKSWFSTNRLITLTEPHRGEERVIFLHSSSHICLYPQIP